MSSKQQDQPALQQVLFLSYIFPCLENINLQIKGIYLKVFEITSLVRENKEEEIPVTSPFLKEGANPLDGCSSPGAPAQQENVPLSWY